MRERPGDAAAEALLLAGGARAILLQLANPAVGRGVAEHSDFADRPLDRLRGTLTYLYVVAFGTPQEVTRVARQVGRAHAPVRSESHDSDDSYDARDETLQLWVAATLYDTAVLMHELVFGALTAPQAQALLDEGAAIATTLGVPRALWPATPADFAAYWSRCESELRVDDAAARVAAALLHPRSGPWWFRLAMPSVRLLTAGLLSPELRAAYALPLDDRRYSRAVRVLRAVYPRLPRAIRHWPKRHYLRRFRAEAGK
ncbi:MAG: oxygenase MpaB family protein [Rhodoglobus sp.]